jgi:hypothetical protein
MTLTAAIQTQFGNFELSPVLQIDFFAFFASFEYISLYLNYNNYFNGSFHLGRPMCSLRRNPLARSPGQVIRPSDKRNFIGTSPHGQVNFLLLDLYLHDHQNVFSKEFNFIMTISNIFDNVFSKTFHIFVYNVLTHKVT